MNRIYHPYDKWEDYPAGFYDNLSGKNKEALIQKVIELFSSQELTREYMNRAIAEWRYSCEHNLTNDAMNKIAYLGQAACCIYAGIPSTITMEAWNLVSKEDRDKADAIAKEIITNYKPKSLIMKTIDDLNNEIAEITNQIIEREKIAKKTKSLRNRISMIRHCVLYLESKPNPEYIKSEIDKLKELIIKRTPVFGDEYTKKTIAKTLTELGIKKLNTQLKTLQYISR